MMLHCFEPHQSWFYGVRIIPHEIAHTNPFMISAANKNEDAQKHFLLGTEDSAVAYAHLLLQGASEESLEGKLNLVISPVLQ
jgi:hypothetical protein